MLVSVMVIEYIESEFDFDGDTSKWTDIFFIKSKQEWIFRRTLPQFAWNFSFISVKYVLYTRVHYDV